MAVASGALDCLEFPVLDFIVATDGFLSVTPGAPGSLVGHVAITGIVCKLINHAVSYGGLLRQVSRGMQGSNITYMCAGWHALGSACALG
jgi:hypothetical protein